MMGRDLLRDDQWERIEGLLPGRAGCAGAQARNNRQFIEAVLWICRTGSPWRDLPERFGHWHTVYTRFARWAKRGRWEALLAALSDDKDYEMVCLDSTVIRAHQHAAGAQKRQASKRSGAPAGASRASCTR
jgi:transposase